MSVLVAKLHYELSCPILRLFIDFQCRMLAMSSITLAGMSAAGHS